MKVQIEKGVWLTRDETDPLARTLVEENAYDFANMHAAEEALANARIYFSFPDAIIEEDFI